MPAFLQAEHQNPLASLIHVDDGYLGGKRHGIRVRGAHGKTPFITTLSLVNGRPAQLKLSIVRTLLVRVSVTEQKPHYQEHVRCTQIAYQGL